MLNTINTLENPLSDLIDEINSTVFSQKEWIDNEFYKIPEMTYSYEKLGKDNDCILNKTLFCGLGGLEVDTYKNSAVSEKDQLINKYGGIVEEKIEDKIQAIENFLLRFNEIDSVGDKVLEAKKSIITGGLKENITFLKIALEGLNFEKEKAILGIYFDSPNKESSKFYIDDEARKEKLKKIEELNTKVFGEKLSNNDENIETSLDYLFEKFENYKKEERLDEKRKLTEEEEDRYTNYISKLQGFSPIYKPKIREKPKSVLNPKLKNIKVHRKYIKDIFNHGLIAHDLMSGDMNHRAYFDDSVSGFTDTVKGTAIPRTKKTEYKSSFDVTRLVGHEIEQHGIAQVSHEKLVGNIRGAQNLEVVEGMAMLGEEFYEYGENMYTDGVDINGKTVKIIDIEKVSTVQSFPKAIMEEILSDEEFLDFLKLQHKIEPNKMSPLDRYLRFKRTGFQRKDITYTTGKIKVAHYYNDIITGKSDGDFSDLYLGKVGFQDIGNLKILKNDIEEKNKGLTEEKQTNLPKNLFFAEATIYGVQQRLKGGTIDSEGFYNYIEKKYPFLDMSKEKIEGMSFGFKRQLLGAIDLNVAHIEMFDKKEKGKLNSRQVKKEIGKIQKKINNIIDIGERGIKKRNELRNEDDHQKVAKKILEHNF